MNHQLAIETKATERYMLGELDQESCQAFEEHYFSCMACAEDVKASAAFLDHARAVLAEEPQKPAAPVWAMMTRRAWVPAAMAACLAMGYLLPRPAGVGGVDGAVASVAIPAGVRGPASQAQAGIMLPAGASIFLVKLDVADDVAAARLLWRVRTADGAVRSFQTARDNQVTLPLRAADFPAGRYEIVLSEDAPGAPVMDRYAFSVAPATGPPR